MFPEQAGEAAQIGRHLFIGGRREPASCRRGQSIHLSGGCERRWLNARVVLAGGQLETN